MQENPSSTAGVINIIEKLHEYVPKGQDDSLHTIPCHGDQLSIERHVDAQRARSGAATPEERLEGLEPSPQEFHKQMLILQVTGQCCWKMGFM